MTIADVLPAETLAALCRLALDARKAEIRALNAPAKPRPAPAAVFRAPDCGAEQQPSPAPGV